MKEKEQKEQVDQQENVKDAQVETSEQLINVDGVSYPLSTLSESAQNIVGVYNSWQTDLVRATNKQQQLKMALDGVAHQIVVQVRSDLQAEVDAKAEAKAEANK